MKLTNEQKKQLLGKAMAGTGCLNHKHLNMAASLAGGELECVSAGKWCRWHVTAPEGKAWACAGIYTITAEWIKGDRKHEDAAIRAAIADLSYGTEDVDEEQYNYDHDLPE